MNNQKIDGVLLRMNRRGTWLFRIVLFLSALFIATGIQYIMDPEILETFVLRIGLSLTANQLLSSYLAIYLISLVFYEYYNRKIDNKKKQYEQLGFFDMTRNLGKKMKREGKLK